MVAYSASLTDWQTSPEQPVILQSASVEHAPPVSHPQKLSCGAGRGALLSDVVEEDEKPDGAMKKLKAATEAASARMKSGLTFIMRSNFIFSF